MRIECERCGELSPIGEFETSRTGIRVTCGACAASFFVPARPASPAGESEGQRCPKCDGAVAAGAAACPRCGLGVDRFASFSDAAAEEFPELDQLWARCQAAWGERDRHDAFLDRAVATGAFAYAARRYRAALRERPGDAEAAVRLERVGRMAEAAILAAPARPRKEEEDQRYRGVVMLLVSLVFITMVALVYMMVRSSGNH